MSAELQGTGSIGEWVPTDSIREWPGNPRKNAHALESVAASLKLYGWGRPIVVNRTGREIVVGHTAYNAAKLLRLERVPVRFVDLSAEQAHALAIADNKLGELAQWDDRMLMAQLAELEAKLPDFDPADVGMVQEDLDRLERLAKSEAPVEGEDPGAQEPPVKPVSEPGEVYELGPHRLMCGDSTNPENVKRLVGSDRAALMATDPPYLVDYDANNHPPSFSSKHRKTNNKSWGAYKDPESGIQFFSKFIKVALEHVLREEVAIYQWHASRRNDLVVRAWEENGLLTHQTIIWVKERAILTRSHFMWQFQPCLYGWKQGSLPARKPPANQSNVWQISQKGQQDGIHPTQKPTEIFEWPISWHTKAGEFVYEPFCGSGSQLIAAAKLGRRCLAMEISPAFCDVIRRRWGMFARSAKVDPGSGAL